jgi:uncharacterized protein YlxW (UPF0749 family)
MIEEILYTILICCLISFWIIGYAYIKAQHELISYENSLEATKKKINQKLESLNKVKKQLEDEAAQLKNELKELQDKKDLE